MFNITKRDGLLRVEVVILITMLLMFLLKIEEDEIKLEIIEKLLHKLNFGRYIFNLDV